MVVVKCVGKMAVKSTIGLLCLITLIRKGKSESDQDFKMCGTWHHNTSPRTVEFGLTQGCGFLNISANESTLFISGAISASQHSVGHVLLDANMTGLSPFCVFWEPLVDRLQVEVEGRNHTLLKASSLQELCCTDLSIKSNEASLLGYGILNGSVRTDIIRHNAQKTFRFFGQKINCKKEFCEEAFERASKVNLIEEAMMKSDLRGPVNTACFQGTVVEMDDNFVGRDVTLPVSRLTVTPLPSVHLPASLKPVGRQRAKVVLTHFSNQTLFKSKGPWKKQSDARVLEHVVGITVEDTIVRELPEPIRISFYHHHLPKNHSRTCVSWDTRKEPNEVTWETEGCKTILVQEDMTECYCNHLTYFSILVQLEPSETQCHLEALTIITAVGCAISSFSCFILLYLLHKKSQKMKKDPSSSIHRHRGLVFSLLFLSLLFPQSGFLAYVVDEVGCKLVGALLHYFLLCSFCWMAVEIANAFRMVSMVFSTPPKPIVWYLMGFGVPVIPVAILVTRDDIYGLREIRSVENISDPYKMCWMQESSNALLAHYVTNVGSLILVFSTGFVVLCVVLLKIQRRHEWRAGRTAFFSMWGLSCLFGTSWALGLLNFGTLSCVVPFLFCIINTLQGFLIMVRYYALEWIRKNGGASSDLSSGSTRQHMLQAQEKS